MPELTILKPDFYDSFSCTADKCRHNCCNQSWNITIDKKTYKTLRALKEPKEFVQKLHSGSMQRNEASTSVSDYAYVVQQSDPEKPWIKRCCFQDACGLCEIHANLGGDYLPHTCRVYPRTKNCYSNLTFERGLFSSCEEVLNMFMKKTTPIQFAVETLEDNKNNVTKEFRILSNALISRELPLKEHYPLFKSIGIAILQNRDYCFEDRMVLLGIFCKKLDEIKPDATAAQVECAVEQFIAGIDAKVYDKILGAQANYKIQLDVAYYMFVNFLNLHSNQEILNKIFLPYGVNLISTIASSSLKIVVTLDEDIYKQQLQKYNLFMEDKQHFLENLFVNEFHNQMMPFLFDNFSDSFLVFASLYVQLRFMISGVIGAEQELSEEKLIDTVAYYGKIAFHNFNKQDLILDFLKINDMNSLAHMVMLLKS